MNSVKTTWEWSAETEAKRLIHTAHNIAVGFFRVNNFFVVPYREVSQTYQAVPFPELSYRAIPRFWDRVKRVDIKNFPLEFDDNLVNAVAELLKGQALPRQGLALSWEKAAAEILNEIYKIMPEKKDAISEIIIHPTNFGTTCSFSVADSFPAAVEMYLRTDQDIYAITEAILSAVTRDEVYRELDGMWSESELKVSAENDVYSYCQIYPDETECPADERIGRILPAIGSADFGKYFRIERRPADGFGKADGKYFSEGGENSGGDD